MILKVRDIGGCLVVLLTKDIVDSLGVSEGDRLLVVSTPHGIQLTPHDPDLAKTVESKRNSMRRHRNDLRELAKRWGGRPKPLSASRMP